jgi:hypothetical protein
VLLESEEGRLFMKVMIRRGVVSSVVLGTVGSLRMVTELQLSSAGLLLERGITWSASGARRGKVESNMQLTGVRALQLQPEIDLELSCGQGVRGG